MNLTQDPTTPNKRNPLLGFRFLQKNFTCGSITPTKRDPPLGFQIPSNEPRLWFSYTKIMDNPLLGVQQLENTPNTFCLKSKILGSELTATQTQVTTAKLCNNPFLGFEDAFLCAKSDNKQKSSRHLRCTPVSLRCLEHQSKVTTNWCIYYKLRCSPLVGDSWYNPSLLGCPWAPGIIAT